MYAKWLTYGRKQYDVTIVYRILQTVDKKRWVSIDCDRMTQMLRTSGVSWVLLWSPRRRDGYAE
jgi:hypothetical protein